jgi:hypothetical protein
MQKLNCILLFTTLIVTGVVSQSRPSVSFPEIDSGVPDKSPKRKTFSCSVDRRSAETLKCECYLVFNTNPRVSCFT